jgi:hypothetical protein
MLTYHDGLRVLELCLTVAILLGIKSNRRTLVDVDGFYERIQIHQCCNVAI